MVQLLYRSQFVLEIIKSETLKNLNPIRYGNSFEIFKISP